MTPDVFFNDFKVTAQTPDPARPMAPAYIIEGPRGARYTLHRNAPRPHMLFACHDRPGKFGIAKIRGVSWFTDKGGTLRPSH